MIRESETFIHPPPAVEPSGKQCNRCLETKALDHFHRLAAMPDGHEDTCKPCRKQARLTRLNFQADATAQACTDCGMTKPIDQFGHTRNGHHRRYCLPCGTARRRQRSGADLVTEKRCTKCGETQPLDGFYLQRRGGEERVAQCRSCRQSDSRLYQATVDRAKRQAYNLAWSAKRRAQWTETDRENSRAYYRAYYASHLERMRGHNRSGAQRRRIRMLDAAAVHDVTVDQWFAIKAFYGDRCLRCGKTEPEVRLTMDHVIPVARGGLHHIGNLQPLCHSCNSGKNNRTQDFRHLIYALLPEEQAHV